MKKKLGLIGLLIVIGLSLNFYSCEKKDSDDEPEEVVGDANLTGIIISSQTGDGLANATLYFTRNLSATDYNNYDYTVTTTTTGNYTLTNAVAGTYLVFVVSNGFFEYKFQVILVTGTNTQDDVVLVEAPTEGSLRIILTWGESPSDLDSHLTGPETGGGRFHMYWDVKKPNDYVSLDTDNTTNYGPETTTISGFLNGMYRYSVHNYSEQSSTGGSGIKSSPAKVELYDSNGLVQTFNPPTFTGSGNTWRVFEFTVNNGSYSVNTINTYVQAQSYTDVTIFKSSNEKANQFNVADF